MPIQFTFASLFTESYRIVFYGSKPFPIDGTRGLSYTCERLRDDEAALMAAISLHDTLFQGLIGPLPALI